MGAEFHGSVMLLPLPGRLVWGSGGSLTASTATSQAVRRARGATEIWGKPAEIIRAKYVTAQGATARNPPRCSLAPQRQRLTDCP